MGISAVTVGKLTNLRITRSHVNILRLVVRYNEILVQVLSSGKGVRAVIKYNLIKLLTNTMFRIFAH